MTLNKQPALDAIEKEQNTIVTTTAGRFFSIFRVFRR